MAVIKIVPMPGVGVPGPQGQAGQAGQSAYQVAVSNGFVGTEQEWLDSLGGGNADIADFVFASDGEESSMTIANHDMLIRTTRTNNQDADIDINSADDIWITANDQVEISSVTDSVAIFTNNSDKKWSFNPDGSISLPSGDSPELSDASIGSGTSGNIVLETRTITAVSDYQDSTNDINGSALILSINQDTQWFADNANGTVTVNFADSTTVQVDSIYDATAQGYAGILFGLVDSINKTFEEIFPLTIVGEKVEPKHYVSIKSNEATWQFEGDGTLVAPTGSPVIVNPAVPGDITLSAYNGVNLSFADVEGAGLKFPDDTVQTTAYTGGDTASHGDFYFDQSTLRVDSSGDMILEANEGDGTVASQIKVGKGDVPINIAAYDRQESSYGTGDWSTAEWQSDGGSAGQVVLTGITSIEQQLNNFNADFQKILINDSILAVYNGASYGGGTATIYVSEAPTEATTVLSIRFIQSLRSGMMIDLDDGSMEIVSSNMSMDIATTGGNDIVLRSSDDLDLRAEDDIRFYTNTDATQQSWTMDSEGLFHLPGDGYISNPVDSSGDGNGYDTLKLVPDQSRESYDQYLIIDPTQPNHIHIRAGGTQDASNAELILGAEENHVAVNDSADSVTIKTKRDDSVWTYQNVNSGGTTFIVNLENSEPDYGDFLIDNDIKYTINYVFRNLETYSTEYTAAAPDGTLLEFAPWTFYTFFRDNGSSYWQFNNQGYLSGPAMGYVNVYGIQNPSTSDNLLVYSNDKVLIAGTNGEFLNDSSVASNQIATIGDLPTGATGSFVSQDGKTITVTNGIITGIV